MNTMTAQWESKGACEKFYAKTLRDPKLTWSMMGNIEPGSDWPSPINRSASAGSVPAKRLGNLQRSQRAVLM